MRTGLVSVVNESSRLILWIGKADSFKDWTQCTFHIKLTISFQKTLALNSYGPLLWCVFETRIRDILAFHRTDVRMSK